MEEEEKKEEFVTQLSPVPVTISFFSPSSPHITYSGTLRF
jgi:hypothetical protein